jgi:serine/threonine-protein kinase
MDRSRWERIQDIFHRLSDMPAPAQHEYLEAAGDVDEAMKAEVRAMLREDSSTASLLDDEGLPHAVQDLIDQHAAFKENAFGPYRIVKPLGEGGMGVVYLAKREDIGSVVAIKLLRDGLLSPDRRNRFLAEQRTLAQLEHPLIARIHDADTLDDGTPWFAMEYVDGKPITEYCREHACSINERLLLFRSVCEAVQYAHRHAIIHRDLKPSNILVRDDGTVKLLDFGIAKQLEGSGIRVEHTLTGLSPMTLPFASPEQIRGGALGTQTDVYSLGVILYELLAGRLPFDFAELSLAEAQKMILEHEPAPPSTARTGKAAWDELDVLTLTAMHKDVLRRYPSVEALIRDIDHYLKAEPLEARPDSVSYRLGKFVVRNRRVLTATAAVCAIVLGLVVFFVLRLNRARNDAVAEATRTHRIERFMLTLFDGGDKSAGPSDSLRAATLLDRGVASARSLNAEPAVQAELYQTLGNMYQKLGKYDQADPLLRSALDRRKSIEGADGPDVAEGLVALGLLRLDEGRLAEAERLAREGLAIDRRRVPANPLAVAKDESALGHVLEERGAYDEAAKLLNEAVQVQSATHEVTTDLSDTTTLLANVNYYQSHLAAADSLFRQALAMDRELFGDVHPRIADDYYGLGLVQHAMNRDAEAERDYRHALAIKQSWYGKVHPDTALIMAAVGQSLVYQGKYDEAAPILQEALAIQEQIFGKVHPQVAQALNVVAVMEVKRGHLAEAEADFRRMAAINRATLGDRHQLVGIALLGLGDVYAEEKQNARAEKSYRDALARLVGQLPAGHPTIAATRLRLGHTLVLERQYQEAASQLLAGYDVLSKQPGPPSPRVQTARKDLVTAYEALGQVGEANRFRKDPSR